MRSFPLTAVLRGLTAAGVITSGDVHLVLWVGGFKSIGVIGPLFLLNVIAGLVLGLALLVWSHWLPVFLSAGFALTTLAAFVISATVGLFGVHETWTGAQQVLAGVAEVVALGCGIVLLVLEGRVAAAQHVRRSASGRARFGLVRR